MTRKVQKAALILAVGGLLTLAAGCGGKAAYPKAAVDKFVGDCQVNYIVNISLDGKGKAFCGCVISKIEKSMSFKDFQRADTRGELQDRTRAPNAVIDAYNACP